MSIAEYATFRNGVWPSTTVMTQTRNFCGRGATQENRLRPLIESWTEISQEASKMGRPKLSGVSKKIANILSNLCGNRNPDKSLFQQCIQLVNSIEPGIKDNNDRSIQVSESYQYSMNLDDDTSDYFVEYHSIARHMSKNPAVKGLATKILNEYARFKKMDISRSPKENDNHNITGCLVNMHNCVKKMMYIFVDIGEKMESGTAIRNRVIAGKSPGEGMRRADDEQTSTFNSGTSKEIVRIGNKLMDSIDILRRGSLSEDDITEITLSVKNVVNFARQFI